MSNEEIVRTCRLLNRHGIKSMTQNIIGLPTETIGETMETLKLNIQCRPTYAWASIFQPYPGTDLGKYAEKQGLLEDSPENIEKSFFDRSILKSRDKKKIEHLQKLFAITVEFPRLLPLTRLLIKLPNNPFFWLVHKLWKGYTIQRRLHPVGYTGGEYLSMVRKFIKLE